MERTENILVLSILLSALALVFIVTGFAACNEIQSPDEELISALADNPPLAERAALCVRLPQIARSDCIIKLVESANLWSEKNCLPETVFVKLEYP